MATKIAYQGAQKCIELLCTDDGVSQVQEFLDALDSSDRRKVDTLFELMGERGRISNDQKFKKLEGSNGIFEFKSFQIRLLCFYAPGGRLIICRALRKKKDKHDKADISFAEACKERFNGEDG